LLGLWALGASDGCRTLYCVPVYFELSNLWTKCVAAATGPEVVAVALRFLCFVRLMLRLDGFSEAL
jgi:hypothetical protein